MKPKSWMEPECTCSQKHALYTIYAILQLLSATLEVPMSQPITKTQKQSYCSYYNLLFLTTKCLPTLLNHFKWERQQIVMHQPLTEISGMRCTTGIKNQQTYMEPSKQEKGSSSKDCRHHYYALSISMLLLPYVPHAHVMPLGMVNLDKPYKTPRPHL